MLLSLFLLMLSQSVAPAAPGAGGESVQAAIQLSDQGMNAEALAALQKIAAANPNNHLARLWIARVHDRMGHPGLAEGVYRSIVLEDPTHVEALVGIGLTLIEQDQIQAGIQALERAEELAPQDAEVLAALGNANRRAGHGQRSVAYFQRVTTVSPTPAHRLALEQARRDYGHRFETQGFDEQFDGATPDTRGTDIGLNLRVSESVRVVGRDQLQRKFGRKENRAGGGVQWRATPDTTLTGQVLVGRTNRVLPQTDYLGQFDYAHHRATWTGTVRYFDFLGSNVTMLSPSVTIAASPTWTLGLRYALTTTTTAATSGVQGHSLHVRGAHEVRSRVWIHGAYMRGVENFETFSTDRIGDFKADTFGAAVQVMLPSLTSIVGGYDYQRRDGGGTMGRFNVSLVQSF